MAAMLKCPNPSCPYLFDPATAPTGVVLACPRCAMRFTLGAPSAQAASSKTAPSGPGNSSMNRAFTGMTKSAAAEVETRRGRTPVRGSKLQSTFLLVVASLALLGAVIAVWYKLSPKKTDEIPADLVRRFKDKNFSMEPPPEPWTRDEDMRAKLDSPYLLVYRRDDPDKRDQPPAYMAIGSRDYETREPRQSELRAVLMEPLRKILDVTTFEPSDVSPETTWLGMDVKGFHFRGRLKSGPVIEGEALHVAHKGIGYWFLGWSGENAAYMDQKPAFADFRAHCKLLDLRKDWKPRSNVAAYKNNEIGYAIFDADELWQENADEKYIKAEDPSADKLLTLKIGNKKDIQKVGNLVLYVVPANGEALAAARQFVTNKRMAEIKAAGEEYQVEFKDRTGSPEGDPSGNVVEASSPVIRFQSMVKDALDQDRLHVVSALKIGDKLVIAHAWSALAERAEFESNFIQIVGSLRAIETN